MRRMMLACVAVAGAALAAADESKPRPTPAEDLKVVQGEWKVASFIQTKNSQDFPKELRFTDRGAKLTFDGNRLLVDGKTVATLANDLPSAPQHNEVGWKELNRLVLLTLPDGRGLWCSYGFRDKKLQITYPHTTSCHRGSGQIVYLERPEK